MIRASAVMLAEHGRPRLTIRVFHDGTHAEILHELDLLFTRRNLSAAIGEAVTSFGAREFHDLAGTLELCRTVCRGYEHSGIAASPPFDEPRRGSVQTRCFPVRLGTVAHAPALSQLLATAPSWARPYLQDPSGSPEGEEEPWI